VNKICRFILNLIYFLFIIGLFYQLKDQSDTDKLIAMISFAISLIVFYSTNIRPWINKPKLQINVPAKAQLSPSGGKGSDSVFIRLKISNIGVTTAKNCTGRLLQVRDNNNKPIEKFDPLPLYWARQSKEEQYKPVDIQGNGDSYFLDVAQIHKPQNAQEKQNEDNEDLEFRPFKKVGLQLQMNTDTHRFVGDTGVFYTILSVFIRVYRWFLIPKQNWRKSSEDIKPDNTKENGDSNSLDIAQKKQCKEWALTLRAMVPSGHTLIKDNDYPDCPNTSLPLGTYYVQIALYGDAVSLKPAWFEIIGDHVEEKPSGSIKKYKMK